MLDAHKPRVAQSSEPSIILKSENDSLDTEVPGRLESKNQGPSIYELNEFTIELPLHGLPQLLNSFSQEPRKPSETANLRQKVPDSTIKPSTMPKMIVSNEKVYDAIKGFPRYELNPVLYTHHNSSQQPLLPRLEGNENSLVQIRIP